jgi:hypothetical protein
MMGLLTMRKRHLELVTIRQQLGAALSTIHSRKDSLNCITFPRLLL